MFARSLLLCILPVSVIGYSNQADPNRHLIVMAPPSIHNSYYESEFPKMVPFYIDYARNVMGRDNVVLVADADTMSYFVDELPADILLEDTISDPWIRDPSPAVPSESVQFKYLGGLPYYQASQIQRSFNKFADKHGIQRTQTSFYMDGGNVVDNNLGKAVVTRRFLQDNNLSYDDGKSQLMAALGLSELAIIAPDEPHLAHADGMVTWLTDDTLAVNEYDGWFRNKVMNELTNSLPGTTIVEVPNNPSDETFSGGFASACGIYVNSVVTEDYIYVPTFDDPMDSDALAVFSSNSHKEIVPVDATGACKMGGSLRCLAWQVQGDHTNNIIQAARDDD